MTAKSEKIVIRLTADQLNKLRQQAEAAHRTLSDFARLVLTGVIKLGG